REGAVERGAVGCRIDQIEALVRLDVASFREVALQHDAVHARADLCDEVRGGTARYFGAQRNDFPPDRDDADFQRLRGSRLLLLSATGAQRDERRSDERRSRGDTTGAEQK